jgi:hypothetical protein
MTACGRDAPSIPRGKRHAVGPSDATRDTSRPAVSQPFGASTSFLDVSTRLSTFPTAS